MRNRKRNVLRVCVFWGVMGFLAGTQSLQAQTDFQSVPVNPYVSANAGSSAAGSSANVPAEAMPGSETASARQEFGAGSEMNSARNAGQAKLFTQETSAQTEASGETGTKFSFSTGFQKLIFAVAAVTLLFMILIYVLKKFTPREAPALPKDVFEVLGKSPLAFRQQLYLMRCGQKLFIVSLSQNGLDRIGEIEDPMEVERLTRRCRGEILGTGNAFRSFEDSSRLSGTEKIGPETIESNGGNANLGQN